MGKSHILVAKVTKCTFILCHQVMLHLTLKVQDPTDLNKYTPQNL